jgi:hypothetical protein
MVFSSAGAAGGHCIVRLVHLAQNEGTVQPCRVHAAACQFYCEGRWRDADRDLVEAHAEQVAEVGRSIYAARLRVLAARLSADGFTASHAEYLAVLCTSALQGALIHARVERNGAPLMTAADELAKMIAAAADGREK